MAADTLTVTKNMQRIVPDCSVGGAHDNLTQLPNIGPGGSISQLAMCNFGVTPFRPGQPITVELDGTLPATAVGLKIQTAPRFDSATGQRPATGSSLWVDLLTFTTGMAPQQELSPAADAYWWRTNVTGTPAAGTPGINMTAGK
jgi:hypothetical protein